MNELGRALTRAEDKLRAHGLTGAKALDVLIAGLVARLEGRPRDDLGGQVAAELPLDGDVDLLGLAWERFFPDLFKGARGQFFTPPPVVELLLSGVELAGRTVLDPTCGAGSFLVQAGRAGARVRGIERDPHLAELARLNLRLAGVKGSVVEADFFAADPEPVDVVVANPPFSVAIDDADVLARYGLSGRVLSDHLFVRALSRWVRPEGHAAIVMPWSLVANGSLAPLRETLLEHFALRAVCALPEGVFRPFGGAAGRAALLWLQRAPATMGFVRWASLSDPGYDVRSRALKPTPGDEVRTLVEGRGWRELPPNAWLPGSKGWTCDTRPLADVATRDQRFVVPAAAYETVALVDLADADRRTGEVPDPVVVAGGDVNGRRVALDPEHVVVSRLRPELGNVAVVPPVADVDAIVGSPEWVPLASELPYFLVHALRTPSWRARLPVRTGQTRPRVDPESIETMEVPWPGDPLARRIDTVSRRLYAERRRLLADLSALQAAMDAYAEGEIDRDTLEERLDALG